MGTGTMLPGTAVPGMSPVAHVASHPLPVTFQAFAFKLHRQSNLYSIGKHDCYAGFLPMVKMFQV